MSNQQTIVLNTGEWLELTSSDTSALTFQVLNGDCYIRGTEAPVAPTERAGLRYRSGQVEEQVYLNQLFPGTNVKRLWARAIMTPCAILITHDAGLSFEAGRGVELTAPATKGAMITPDDSAPLAEVPRALYVGFGGDIAMELVDAPGVLLTLSNFQAGIVYPLRPSHIYATGTTATNIVGLG